MPQRLCEIAFTKDPDGSPLWQDVSDYVEWQDGVTISRRRSHELDEVQPGTMSLTLLNSDGRFTAGRTSSPYYPYVTLNRPIRIRARWPGSVNLVLEKQGKASDVALFSASGGLIALETTTVPAGQASSIRWSNWSVGNLLRIGSTSTTSPTEQALPVTVGRTYSLQAQVARSSAATASVAARIRWYSQAGAFLSENTGSALALALTFGTVSVSATAPASAVSARLVLTTTAGNASSVVYAGSWQVEESAAPSTWVSPGVEYKRYTGFIDRWPHAWTNGVLGNVQITATDRQKLLGRDKVRQAIVEEVLATGPRCYYPLTEPSNSVQGGNQATTPQPDMVIQQTGSLIGTAEFGKEGGPDNSSGVLLSPWDINNGMILVVPMLTTALGGGAGISVAVWVNFGVTTQTGQNRLIYVDNGADTVHFRVNYAPSTNSLTVGARLPGGSVSGSTTSFNLDDNTLHLVVATAEFIGATLRIRAYIDGVMGIDTSPALSGGAWPSITRVRVGGLSGSALDPPELLQGLVAHVACWNSVLTQTQAQGLSDAEDGFAGELSGARAARIAAWAGVTDTAFDVGASLMDSHPAQEQTPLAALKQVALSEAGAFFIDGAGTAVLHGRNRRQVPPAVSITLAAHQCGPDLQFVMDDQLLINDVSVSRSGKTVTRVIDQTSIDTNQGTYAANIDTLLYTDTEALDRASYTVTTYGYPQPRAGQISVDLHSIGTVWDMMLASEIGQRIEITGLPSEAPATALDLWCEGVADAITDSTWTIIMDTSPFRDIPVFILDDATFGTLDNNSLGW